MKSLSAPSLGHLLHSHQRVPFTTHYCRQKTSNERQPDSFGWKRKCEKKKCTYIKIGHFCQGPGIPGVRSMGSDVCMTLLRLN